MSALIPSPAELRQAAAIARAEHAKVQTLTVELRQERFRNQLLREARDGTRMTPAAREAVEILHRLPREDQALVSVRRAVINGVDEIPVLARLYLESIPSEPRSVTDARCALAMAERHPDQHKQPA